MGRRSKYTQPQKSCFGPLAIAGLSLIHGEKFSGFVTRRYTKELENIHILLFKVKVDLWAVIDGWMFNGGQESIKRDGELARFYNKPQLLGLLVLLVAALSA